MRQENYFAASVSLPDGEKGLWNILHLTVNMRLLSAGNSADPNLCFYWKSSFFRLGSPATVFP